METVETIMLEQVEKRLDARQCCLAGSSFVDVNLAGASFNDVNFSGADIRNANLSNWSIQDVNLAGLHLTNADLRGAAISDCLTDGMTVDGIAISELMAAYRRVNGQEWKL